MYAVVEVGGMQWRVSKKAMLRVPKVDAEVGKSIELDRVLLVVDKGDVNVGKPVIQGMSVKATVVSHGKDDKVKVFKKKRRKGYRVLKGHRQEYTEIRIDAIGAAPKAAKPEKKPEAANKDVAPKAAPKKGTDQKASPAGKPKPAAKKPASSPKKTSGASGAAKKPAPKSTSAGKKEG